MPRRPFFASTAVVVPTTSAAGSHGSPQVSTCSPRSRLHEPMPRWPPSGRQIPVSGGRRPAELPISTATHRPIAHRRNPKGLRRRRCPATEGLSFSEKQLQDSSQGGEAQFSPSRKAKARKPLSKWFRFRSAIGLLLQLVLMFAIVIIGVMLGNWLSFRFQQPSPTLPSTTFLWDCNQQNGKAPLSVTCTGPVGPNIQGWIWDFGDGTMMQKSIVTHVYQKPGTYKITLTVTSSANQHTSTYNSNAGSYTIEVKP